MTYDAIKLERKGLYSKGAYMPPIKTSNSVKILKRKDEQTSDQSVQLLVYEVAQLHGISKTQELIKLMDQKFL